MKEAREFEAHIQRGAEALNKVVPLWRACIEAFALTASSASIEQAQTDALIDAVEQQIEAWEDY